MVSRKNNLKATFKGRILEAGQQWLDFAEAKEVAWFVQNKRAVSRFSHGEGCFKNDKGNLSRRELVEAELSRGRIRLKDALEYLRVS